MLVLVPSDARSRGEAASLQVGAVVALLPERLHDVFRDPEVFRHLSLGLPHHAHTYACLGGSK